MSCQTCKSERMIDVSAKCSDMFTASIGDHEYDGYVPHDMEIGGGDYLEIYYCADCGQIQGDFPLHPTKLESGKSEGDDEEYDDD
jgi:hypothetical protein